MSFQLFSRFPRFFHFFACLLIAIPIFSYVSAVPAPADGVRNPNNKLKITPSFTSESNGDVSGIQSGSPDLSGPPRTGKIKYHGGFVNTGTIDIYYIYYGSWSSADRSTLDFLMNNIGSTGYTKILASYNDGNNKSLSGNVRLAGTFLDNYSVGKSITDNTMVNVVSNAIKKAQWPADPGAVYFILGSSDVNHTSGFCSDFCGFHTFDTIHGADIKYAFVGDPTKCLDGCAPLYANSISPNNNPGIDGMASIIMHEMVESITDGDYDAWFDDFDYEMADKCVWNFGGSTFIKPARNGALYNLDVGQNQYLVQLLWHRTKQCRLTA
ncbi:4898_t:CDS:2 [Paraglomus occultum]|uniref:4898_t:CDS:1 n=1 Tax=Paraglomus occultum TaxID=144539 RepID=A0A9N8VTA8_9GLOM|nr:4898_t:CDS:2 [Paraglomus occultum]